MTQWLVGQKDLICGRIPPERPRARHIVGVQQTLVEEMEEGQFGDRGGIGVPQGDYVKIFALQGPKTMC